MKKDLFTKENIIKGLKWFFFSYIWLAILTFIIDVVTKNVIRDNVMLGKDIWLIPNFLYITYVQNDGMAWGADTGNKIANIAVFTTISIIGTILITGVLIKYWKKFGQVQKSALMLMLSGCVGNLIDRAFYIMPDSGIHYVIDWIGFRFGNYDFPVFNIADSCLVIGTFMILIYSIVIEIKEDKAKKLEAQNSVVTVNEVEKVEETSENKEEVKTETKDTPVIEDKPKEEVKKVVEPTKKPKKVKKPSDDDDDEDIIDMKDLQDLENRGK